MTPFFDVWCVVGAIGVTQSLFLSGVVWRHGKGPVTSRRLLGLFLLVCAVEMAGIVLSYSRYYLVWPHLFGLSDSFDFSIGPLFYLYVRSMTSRDWTWQRRHVWHFVPFFLVMILMCPFFVLDAADKLPFVEAYYRQMAGLATPDETSWINPVFMMAIYAQALTYLVLSYVRLRRHEREVENDYSDTHAVNLSWLRYLTIGLFMLWMVWFLLFFNDVTGFSDIGLTVAFSIYIYGLAYRHVRQPPVFAGQETVRRYEGSPLTVEAGKRHVEDIVHLMETEKLFVNPALTVQDLADRLQTSGRYVSQSINQHTGKSFYDFVNGYRVAEAKKRLTDETNQTVLAVAYAVGYNSKSAFNAAFRKYTGMTPSEYRKSRVMAEKKGSDS